MSFIIRSQAAPTLPREGLNFWFDAQNHPSLVNDNISVDRSSNYPNFSLLNSGTKVTYTTNGGGSFIFAGITNSFVRTPINVTSTNTVTWVIWFRRTGTPVNYTGLFFNRLSGSSNNVAGVHFGDGANATKLRYTWNSNHFSVETSLTTPQNIWTFCSVAVSSAGATFTMIPGTSSKQTYRHSGITNDPLTFTTSFIGWDGTQSRFLDGRVSQAFFYTRTLSDVEVQTIYDLTLSRHYPLGVQPEVTTTTTSTSTSTTTSTTTVLPVNDFAGREGGDFSELCQEGGVDVTLYSSISWASLKVGDILYLDNGLNDVWKDNPYFYNISENQYIEINQGDGKIVLKPTGC